MNSPVQKRVAVLAIDDEQIVHDSVRRILSKKAI